MKVSLISTVKDAGPAIHDFVASVGSQTRPPDEVIVVDGGSKDGTFRALESAEGVQAISEPGANISRGRNIAIRAAAHELIAVTDADCVLAPDWLEHLVAPLERGADVAAGFYEPIAESFLQVCSAAVSLPEREEIRPGWMPSSRSIAFRRDVYEAAGGYPEWLHVGEDMYFNHCLRAVGAQFRLAPDAITRWRVRPTLGETWRQYAGYGEGDALAGMYPERHLIRFATYGFASAAVLRRSRWMLPIAVAGAAAHVRKPLRRAWRRLPGGAERAAAVVAVPAMVAFIDAAKAWGYIRGLATR